MVQSQIKLKLNRTQEVKLNEWLWILTGVWNFGVRKIELDSKDGIYYSKMEFNNLLAGHGKKLDIPSHVLQGTMANVHLTWQRYFRKTSRKPKFKGNRNKLNYIPFPDSIKPPIGNYIGVPRLGKVRFHKQDIPEGKIKCGRIVKRASGWYLCLFIDAEREPIERKANGVIGIDPGYKSLLTLSTGEKIEHPKEFQHAEKRLGQAQRGKNKKLVARMHERIRNQRKDRNHKLSLKLVQENKIICFSKDNIVGLAKIQGKNVSSSGHYQLRRMISYKSRAGDTEYIEVDPKNSTMTCSVCGALTGPTGWDGLAARQWVCMSCGTQLDRDINAAQNTLLSGLEQPSNKVGVKPDSELCNVT